MGDKANVLVGISTITIGEGGGAIIIGYTFDGVTMNVRSDYGDINVDEVSGDIKRILTDQGVEVTLNIAEGSLVNLGAVIPGSSLSAPTLTLGGGPLQQTKLTIEGIASGGAGRTIILNDVNPTGEVGIPYKKGEISVVPVTFAALINDSGVYGTVIDSPAVELTSLTENLTANFVPAFAGGTYIYTLAATNLESSVILTATLAGSIIKYTYGTVYDKTVASGAGETIPLAVGQNIVTIKVSKSTLATMTYWLTITRAAP